MEIGDLDDYNCQRQSAKENWQKMKHCLREVFPLGSFVGSTHSILLCKSTLKMFAPIYFDDDNSCGVISCLHIYCTMLSRNYHGASRLQLVWWKGNFTVSN